MAMREEQQQQQQECDFCESSNNNNNSKITSRQRSPQQPRHRQQQQQPRTRRPYRIFTIHVGVWSVCLLLLVTTLSSFSIGNNNMMRFRGVSAWSLSPSSNSLRRTASSFGSRNSDNSRSLTMSIDSRELRFFYGGSSTLDHVFRHQHQPFSSSSSSSSSSAVLENTRQQSDAFIAVAEGARNIASMSHQHRHSTQSSSSSSTAPCVKTYANSKHQTTATTTTQFERTATTTVTKTTVYASSSRKARTTTTTSSSSSSTTSGLTVHSAAAAFANSGICSSGSLSASSSRYGFYQSSAFPFSTGKEQDESSSSSSDSSFPLDSSFPSSAFFSPAGSWNHDSSSLQFPQQHHHHHDYYHQLLPRQPKQGYGTSIQLTEEECALFTLLRQVRRETGLDTTLRVAGGWVRDKLLATPEFQTYHTVFDVGTKQGLLRLTSKFRKSSAAASAAAYSRTTGSSSAGRQGTKVLLTAAVNGQHDHQPVDIDIVRIEKKMSLVT